MSSNKTLSIKEAKNRAQKLREEINKNDRLYYIENQPELSDSEYDELMRELRILEDAHPELITPDSPTQRVSGQVAEGFHSVEHLVPMIRMSSLVLGIVI